MMVLRARRSLLTTSCAVGPIIAAVSSFRRVSNCQTFSFE
jgi:hypothetical protein